MCNLFHVQEVMHAVRCNFDVLNGRLCSVCVLCVVWRLLRVLCGTRYVCTCRVVVPGGLIRPGHTRGRGAVGVRDERPAGGGDGGADGGDGDREPNE